MIHDPSPQATVGANADLSAAREELRLASRDLGNGRHLTELSVPGVHCGGCMRTVESGLAKLQGVEHVRVNLSTKRATVTWRGESAPDLLAALDGLGFPGHPTEQDDARADPELARLIRALAVAGFSAMNIMLLSVSIWSGADSATRSAFHWISAVLALPCLLYSGRIFFSSAWSAVRRGRTNMDVPISIGVCLAFALSLYDTVHDGPHAYFDAATSLIFFLLIGRTLDHVMREKARTAVRGLMRLVPRGATVLREDGRREHIRIEDIAPGMRIALAAGERVPVDAIIEEGKSDLDCAIATGESTPRRIAKGDAVQAGALNLTGPLTIIASARAEHSFVAEMVRLMEAAEGGRARYRRLADRAAALYSPVVHATAFVTLLGWLLATGDWHRAITIAIAVLIITCPCALGLAVPIVQVVAARRLFEKGILVKDGSAIERIGEIDTVVFDKTGTLTLGQARVVEIDGVAPHHLAIAARIAQASNHPFARAIANEAISTGRSDPVISDVVEEPGMGLSAHSGANLYRLGRAEWALDASNPSQAFGTVLSRDGQFLARFAFEDTLRPEARQTADALRTFGLHLVILSGDAPDPVVAVARTLGIDDYAAGLMPAEKVARLEQLNANGHKVLMVGDGINDAPALAAAHVSMAPATAADIGRTAADFVFLHEGFDAIAATIAVARASGQLVRQNFALAVAYNALALPVAIAGYVTPLIAAFAMSFSSILVVVNALRLRTAQAMRAPATNPEDGCSAREALLGARE